MLGNPCIPSESAEMLARPTSQPLRKPHRRCNRSRVSSHSCCSASASSVPACSLSPFLPDRPGLPLANHVAGRSGTNTSRGKRLASTRSSVLPRLSAWRSTGRRSIRIKALFRSAVINGVVAVPTIAAMMVVISKHSAMGKFTASARLQFFGWAATAVMATAAVKMFALG